MIPIRGETIVKNQAKLTEKELAIGMWLYVKENIPYCDNIPLIKREYLHKHHKVDKWKNNCILCSKYRLECSECPLGSCSNEYKTLWSVVVNGVWNGSTMLVDHPFTLEERLEACDKIIEAIEKDIPDDYIS